MHSLVTQLILTEQMIAYALTDANGRVQSVYGDPELLWGCYNPTDVIGQALLVLVPELTGSEEAVQTLLTGGIEHLRFESLNREDSRGNTRYVTLVLRGYHDPQTATDGLLFLVQDVTAHSIVQQELMQRHNELRLLQERLERQNRELVASNRELRLMNEIRSSFISVAAHELRTPLTSIYGFLELLQDTGAENLTAQQNEHLGWIETSTQRLLVTLNELLDAARIDSDRLELVLRPIQMREVVDDAMLEIESHLSTRNQRLNLDIPADLPTALCDPARIEQVVGHLLSNASKFTPEGGTVGLAIRPTASGEFLRLSISDQGHGIEEETDSHLFERFFRSEQARMNGTFGAGLGLYIARSLVELHGGEIWYESQPGQGSTFHVTVPVVMSAPALAVAINGRSYPAI